MHALLLLLCAASPLQLGLHAGLIEERPGIALHLCRWRLLIAAQLLLLCTRLHLSVGKCRHKVIYAILTPQSGEVQNDDRDCTISPDYCVLFRHQLLGKRAHLALGSCLLFGSFLAGLLFLVTGGHHCDSAFCSLCKQELSVRNYPDCRSFCLVLPPLTGIPVHR